MKFLNKENSIINNDINIKCYFLDDLAEEKCKKFIVPASPKREWMDKPNQSYAYYCAPLVAANQLGYNILYQNETEVFWNGGDKSSDVKIIHKKGDEYFSTCMSHFVVGIITFTLPVLFHTPPGWGLLVSGPPNYPVQGLQALEGLVETNWSPYTFTMNFKITEKNRLIKIPQYSTICRIIPYPLNLNEKTSLEFGNIKENKKLESIYSAWVKSRLEFNSSPERTRQSDRQFFYRDGIDLSGNLISEGAHKLDYKYKIENKETKCPFLASLFNKK